MLLLHPGFPSLFCGQCASKYQALDPNHTMCVKDGAQSGKRVILGKAWRDRIVSEHNEIRGQVNPPAANMQKLVSELVSDIIIITAVLACLVDSIYLFIYLLTDWCTRTYQCPMRSEIPVSNEI